MAINFHLFNWNKPPNQFLRRDTTRAVSEGPPIPISYATYKIGRHDIGYSSITIVKVPSPWISIFHDEVEKSGLRWSSAHAYKCIILLFISSTIQWGQSSGHEPLNCYNTGTAVFHDLATHIQKRKQCIGQSERCFRLDSYACSSTSSSLDLKSAF